MKLIISQYASLSIYMSRCFSLALVKKFIHPKHMQPAESKPKPIFFPKQHWEKVKDEQTYIIPYSQPVKNITPYGEVAQYAQIYQMQPFQSPVHAKGIKVAIVGPASTGKSLIFNQLINKEGSATSNKRGCTYSENKGVITHIEEKLQMEFIDTQSADKVKNVYRSTNVLTRSWNILPNCDVALYVINSVRKVSIIEKESVRRLKLVTKLNQSIIYENNNQDLGKYVEHLPTILIANKMDLVTNKKRMNSIVREVEDLGEFNKTHYISALTGYGIQELMQDIKAYSIERPWEYNPNYIVHKPDTEKVLELIKKAVFNKTYKEIPYNTDIKITSWVCMSNGEIHIEANVIVDKRVQKSILIGSDGKQISEIAKDAEADIIRYLQRPIKLLLLVKKANN